MSRNQASFYLSTNSSYGQDEDLQELKEQSTAAWESVVLVEAERN